MSTRVCQCFRMAEIVPLVCESINKCSQSILHFHIETIWCTRWHWHEFHTCICRIFHRIEIRKEFLKRVALQCLIYNLAILFQVFFHSNYMQLFISMEPTLILPLSKCFIWLNFLTLNQSNELLDIISVTMYTSVLFFQYINLHKVDRQRKIMSIKINEFHES